MPTSPRLRAIFPLSLSLVLAACGQSPQPGGFHGMPPAEVTTIKVEPKTLPATFEYVGQTTGSKEVEVRARVTGILEKKLFQEGAPVKAGQVLFVIDPQARWRRKPPRWRPRSCVPRHNRRRPARELARLKPLAEKRAVGQKEADDAHIQPRRSHGGGSSGPRKPGSPR